MTFDLEACVLLRDNGQIEILVSVPSKVLARAWGESSPWPRSQYLKFCQLYSYTELISAIFFIEMEASYDLE